MGATGDEDEKDDAPGLIDLDMGQFGSGTMNDPLRHAMGMRSAQDACKMRMWNSFPMLFQNTIFHGEQDETIKALRHGAPLSERLVRSKELKEMGNAGVKAASASDPSIGSGQLSAPKLATPSQEENAMSEQIQQVEQAIADKEKELRELRKQRTDLREARAELVQERTDASNERLNDLLAQGGEWAKQLEDAITNYEKAAGILRFVECVRLDWKNDDGSYKGIEDEWLEVDASALEGDDAEADEAKDLVTSSYLNIALASQKLGKFDQMKGACDEILDKINPTSVKALFRRAQARIGPVSAVDEDTDAAIQDLHAAAQLAPQNQEVRGLLVKLRTERKAQHSEDRSKFAGLFDRGQVVTNDPRTEVGAKLDPGKLDLRDPKVQRMLDIRPGPDDY